MAIPSSPPAPTTSASASRLEIVLFFFSGLGSSLCYIATLSSLVFYKSTYGAQSYIYINLAVYLPLLPVAIAQARYDQDVDRLVGSANAFLCRGIVGYVLSIGALASIPLSNGGLIFVCLPAVVIGAAGAILQGILFLLIGLRLGQLRRQHPKSQGRRRGGHPGVGPRCPPGVGWDGIRELGRRHGGRSPTVQCCDLPAGDMHYGAVHVSDDSQSMD